MVSEAISTAVVVVMVAAIVAMSTRMKMGVALLTVWIVTVVVALVMLSAVGVAVVVVAIIVTAVVRVGLDMVSAVAGSVRRRMIRGAGAPEAVPLRRQHGAEPREVAVT